MRDIDRAVMWSLGLSHEERIELLLGIADGVPWGNLRNLRFYLEACPDLSIFNGCFPRGIRPADVDGEVEINGHLFRYDKKGPHGEISRGSAYTATNLARERGDLTLFAWGDRFDIQSIKVCKPSGWTERTAATTADVQQIAREWATEADKKVAA